MEVKLVAPLWGLVGKDHAWGRKKEGSEGGQGPSCLETSVPVPTSRGTDAPQHTHTHHTYTHHIHTHTGPPEKLSQPVISCPLSKSKAEPTLHFASRTRLALSKQLLVVKVVNQSAN